MFTLLLFLACDVENYTIEPPTNPLAIDDDGDGYSEFMGDKDDTDPELYPYSETYENEAYLEQSCSPVDINITSEQAVNTINLEPVIDVAVDNPQPVVENNVTVDLTELAKTLDGITTVLQQLNTTLQGSNHNVNINSEAEATIAIEGGGYEQREYFQNILGSHNADCQDIDYTINGNTYTRHATILFENNTNDIAIITTLIIPGNSPFPVYFNGIEVDRYWFVPYLGDITQQTPFTSGTARYVLNPGETIEAGCDYSQYSGYYFNRKAIIMGYYLY